MTREQAIKAAFAWLEIRKEVREELIKAAREAHPLEADIAEAPVKPWENNTVRKLYQFPSDLSEERLLGLIAEDTIGDKDG
jgi:hypothetical protein